MSNNYQLSKPSAPHLPFNVRFPDSGVVHQSSKTNHDVLNAKIPHTHATEPEDPIHKGGSITSGGAFFPSFPQNPKDAYHYILNMTPQQHEMQREIASQLLGGVPSPMWDDLLGDEHKQLEADPEHYENIIRMPNTHATARMLEADHGGGFFSALKHVGRVAAQVYHSGRKAAVYLNQFKEPLINAFGLDPYREQINTFIDRMSDMDKVVNPLVEATIEATNPKASYETRNQVKKVAKDHLKQAAQAAADEMYVRRKN